MITTDLGIKTLLSVLTHAQWIGLIGMTFCVLAQLRLHLDQDYAKSPRYSKLNITAGLMIGYWAFYSGIILIGLSAIAWVGISLVGLYKSTHPALRKTSGRSPYPYRNRHTY